MRFDIFSVLLLGFSFGVGLEIFFPVFFPEMLFACLLFGIALFSVFFREKGAVLVSLFFLVAAGGVSFAEQKRSYGEELPEFSETVSGRGQIISDVKEKGFSSEAEFRFDNCANTCPKEKIRLELPKTFEALPGESFFLSCVLEKPKEVIEMSGRTLPWRMILLARGIGYTCRPDRFDRISRSGESFQTGLFRWKHRFLEALDRTIVPQYAPLAAGMLLGSDDAMPSDERQVFVRVGLSHVTAVSGFNIVLVGSAFFLLAIGLGWYRRSAAAIAIASIVLYVLLVGAPASAVRAGIMGCAFFIGSIIGRPGVGWRFLLFALAAMLFMNPLVIRYDVGFELSFLATAAILLSLEIQTRIPFPKSWLPKLFLETAFVTLVIEALLVPVLFVSFGQVSLVSIAVNTILLPLVSPIMLFSFLSGVVGMIFSFSSDPFSLVASFLLFFFSETARMFSDVSFALVSFNNISPLFFAVGWYAIACAVFFALLRRRRYDESV